MERLERGSTECDNGFRADVTSRQLARQSAGLGVQFGIGVPLPAAGGQGDGVRGGADLRLERLPHRGLEAPAQLRGC